MTWSPRNRCGERKDSEGYSDDDDDMADEDENEKVGQDVGEKRESLTCRQTTVIKTAEGIVYSIVYTSITGMYIYIYIPGII